MYSSKIFCFLLAYIEQEIESGRIKREDILASYKNFQKQIPFGSRMAKAEKAVESFLKEK